MADETISQRLDSMTTRWSVVRRAHQASIVSAGQARNELVLRYSKAIRAYVRAILQDDGRADEVAQDAIVRLLSGDFAGADPNRGRFRDLLKVSVRNMARNHWAKENRRRPAAVDVDEIAGNDGSSDDPNWLASWRQNALDLTWSALENFERSQPDSSAVVLLRLRAAFPDANSEELAERLSEKRLRVSTFGESWVGETFFGSSIAGSVVSVREMFVRRCTNTAGHERCDRRVASFAFVGRVVSCKPNLNHDL